MIYGSEIFPWATELVKFLNDEKNKGLEILNLTTTTVKYSLYEEHVVYHLVWVKPS